MTDKDIETSKALIGNTALQTLAAQHGMVFTVRHALQEALAEVERLKAKLREGSDMLCDAVEDYTDEIERLQTETAALRALFAKGCEWAAAARELDHWAAGAQFQAGPGCLTGDLLQERYGRLSRELMALITATLACCATGSPAPETAAARHRSSHAPA